MSRRNDTLQGFHSQSAHHEQDNTMIRLGIIADTHFPTRIPTLPYEAIEDAFRNVDAILHAGDIESPEVLHHLSGIAPVQAVRGDDDHFDLPLRRVLTLNGTRIGLTHGHRSLFMEEWYRVRRRLGYSGTREMCGRLDGLLRRFGGEALDVLIFGHSHQPFCEERDGVLLFNPGAVYAMTLDSALWQLPREQNPVRRRMLKRCIQRYRQHSNGHRPRSTVGVLEIGDNRALRARLIDLPLIDPLLAH